MKKLFNHYFFVKGICRKHLSSCAYRNACNMSCWKSETDKNCLQGEPTVVFVFVAIVIFPDGLKIFSVVNISKLKGIAIRLVILHECYFNLFFAWKKFMVIFFVVEGIEIKWLICKTRKCMYFSKVLKKSIHYWYHHHCPT